MKIGIVTTTDPETVSVRVQFPDHDGVVSYWLPVMQKKTLKDKVYWMPDPGEHVVCLMDEHDEFGVVLGAIYSDEDAPPVVSQDKYHAAFADGTTIEYDRSTHKLTAIVQGDVEATVSGNVSANVGGEVSVTVGGTLTADVSGDTTITTPTFTINGTVVINGMLTQGTGSAGGGATMLGPVTVTNDVTAGGKSLMTHTHPGDSGGTTGPPN